MAFFYQASHLFTASCEKPGLKERAQHRIEATSPLPIDFLSALMSRRQSSPFVPLASVPFFRPPLQSITSKPEQTPLPFIVKQDKKRLAGPKPAYNRRLLGQRKLETVEYGITKTRPDRLFFTFHGLGRNGFYMEKVAREILEHFPRARVVSLHAPQVLSLPSNLNNYNINMPSELYEPGYDIAPDMQRQWFNLQRSKPAILTELHCISARVNKYVDSLCRRLAVSPQSCAYIGFSQGGVVALYSGLRRKYPLGSIVAHSTIFWGGFVPRKTLTPIYYLYGDDDPSISQILYKKSIRRLQRTTKDFDSEILPGQGHYISSASRQKICDYLKAKLT